jgi:ABC-type glycerol-3-phosphate transport system substrate-binding protein
MKKLMLFLGGFLTCLALAGCSKGEGQGPSSDARPQSQETQSKVTAAKNAQEYDATPMTTENSLLNAKFLGGFAYGWGINLQLFEIDRIDPKEGTSEYFFNVDQEIEETEGEQQRFLYCYDIGKTGGGTAVVSIQYEDTTKYYLTQFDEKGNFKKNTEIEKGAEFLHLSPAEKSDMAVDYDGNVLLLSKDVVMISSEGKKVAQFSVDEGTSYAFPIRTMSGELWIYCQKWNVASFGILKADFSKGSLEEIKNVPKEIRGIGAITGEDKTYEALAYDEYKVMGYDKSQDEWVILVQLADYGINGGKSTRVGKMGEQFVIIGFGGAATLLTPRSENAPKKETIVIATTQRYSRLDDLMAAYNKSQDRYVVKVVEYAANAQSTLEYQDPVNRMMADVLADDPPDLFDLKDFFLLPMLTPHWQDMLEKEYIEDLGPYLDQSKKLSRDEYDEKVLAMCMHQGKLAALPTGYMLTTMLVDSNDFGGRYGWSVKEMIAYDKAHPKMELIKDATSGTILYLCTYYSMKDFVDFEKKETHFDSQEFREILEYAASYPAGDYSIWYTAEERLVNVQILYGLMNIQYFQNVKFEGHAQIIGFPTGDGSPVSGMDMDVDGCAFAICKRSSKKDAAWDFIEFAQDYLMEDTERYLDGFGGFPARKKVLDKVLAEISDEDGRFSTKKGKVRINGSYSYHPFTDEEKALFDKMVESATTATPDTRMVWNILDEETKTYFQGQKSIDQTIDAIQSRVQLYLMEN